MGKLGRAALVSSAPRLSLQLRAIWKSTSPDGGSAHCGPGSEPIQEGES